MGSVSGRAAVEDLVLDRDAVPQDPVDMAVEPLGKVRRVVEFGKRLAEHLARRKPEHRQGGRVGISEAPLPIEGIDEVGNRRQGRLEKVGLAGEHTGDL